MKRLIRSPAADELAKILEAARLFYEKGQSQQIIADRLRVTQSTVSRYITAAKDAGYITFHIETPSEIIAEEKLRAYLLPKGVRRTHVVPRAPGYDLRET